MDASTMCNLIRGAGCVKLLSLLFWFYQSKHESVQSCTRSVPGIPPPLASYHHVFYVSCTLHGLASRSGFCLAVAVEWPSVDRCSLVPSFPCSLVSLLITLNLSLPVHVQCGVTTPEVSPTE